MGSVVRSADVRTQGMDSRMRVVIADDHAVSRRGLALLFADHFGQVDVAEAECLDAAIALLAAGPAVEMVVVDLRMPGMRGADGIATLREAFPLTRVVVLSGSEAREDVLAALAAGAHAFIRKAESEDALVRALRLVLDGGVYVPPDLATLPGHAAPLAIEPADPASLPMAGRRRSSSPVPTRAPSSSRSSRVPSTCCST